MDLLWYWCLYWWAFSCMVGEGLWCSRIEECMRSRISPYTYSRIYVHHNLILSPAHTRLDPWSCSYCVILTWGSFLKYCVVLSFNVIRIVTMYCKPQARSRAVRANIWFDEDKLSLSSMLWCILSPSEVTYGAADHSGKPVRKRDRLLRVTSFLVNYWIKAVVDYLWNTSQTQIVLLRHYQHASRRIKTSSPNDHKVPSPTVPSSNML